MTWKPQAIGGGVDLRGGQYKMSLKAPKCSEMALFVFLKNMK